MRAAMAETSPQLSSDDATRIRKDYPTAYTTPSGLMYINRGPGAGAGFPRIGDTGRQGDPQRTAHADTFAPGRHAPGRHRPGRGPTRARADRRPRRVLDADRRVFRHDRLDDFQNLLAADLARLYGVPAKRLNEQVKRNAGRFPEDLSWPV